MTHSVLFNCHWLCSCVLKDQRPAQRTACKQNKNMFIENVKIQKGVREYGTV